MDLCITAELLHSPCLQTKMKMSTSIFEKYNIKSIYNTIAMHTYNTCIKIVIQLNYEMIVILVDC